MNCGDRCSILSDDGFPNSLANTFSCKERVHAHDRRGWRRHFSVVVYCACVCGGGGGSEVALVSVTVYCHIRDKIYCTNTCTGWY